MRTYEGVEIINVNNNSYPLNGHNLADVLAALNIDETKVQLEQEGRTLYVSNKAGTKGSVADLLDMALTEILERINSENDNNSLDIEAVLDSTLIREAKYNPKDLELEIIFRNGSIYLYKGVPLSVAEGLMNARSAGAYFNAEIKDIFSYERKERDFTNELEAGLQDILASRTESTNELEAKLKDVLAPKTESVDDLEAKLKDVLAPKTESTDELEAKLKDVLAPKTESTDELEAKLKDVLAPKTESVDDLEAKLKDVLAAPKKEFTEKEILAAILKALK